MTGPSQGHNATPRVPSVKSAIGILLNGFPVAVARSINCPWYVDMADKASKKIAPMVEWYHHLIWAVFQAPCLPFILVGWSGFPSNDLMDGDIPQYIGFVGRITYENRPNSGIEHFSFTVCSFRINILHQATWGTAHCWNLSCGAAGRKASHQLHRWGVPTSCRQGTQANLPDFTCDPLEKSVKLGAKWSLQLHFSSFFCSILHHVTYWGFFFWLGPRLGRPGGKTIQQAGNWWTTLQTVRSAFLPERHQHGDGSIRTCRPSWAQQSATHMNKGFLKSGYQNNGFQY